jgi:NADH-quinone oxidoreductase subunit G
MSLGSRGGELMRVVARDRYVNGLNGEFLCVKGRFAHPFVNHEDRLRTPLIRYKKGGRLIAATWDDAIRFTAERLDKVASDYGPNALAVVGSPRLTNESLYALRKFATELVGTDSYTTTDAFSLQPFLDNLGAPLATHKDIRHAKTILLIGGEPEELQPLTGKQIRQAVNNGGARLIIVNSVPIRLREQAEQFVHILPGTEDAIAFALHDPAHNNIAAQKTGTEVADLVAMREALSSTSGDLVIMFGGELSAAGQAAIAQLPMSLSNATGRVLLHPLPLFNNSLGAHLTGMMSGELTAQSLLDAAGSRVRALYLAGAFLPQHLEGREDALTKLDFLVVQELFETAATKAADVVLPAASFAEIDGTFTNNDGFVQRVRQSIPTLHQSKPDWMITAQLAKELGVDFGFEMSATTVFREISEKMPPFAGMRYPLLKDEQKPVQVKHEARRTDISAAIESLRQRVESLSGSGEKSSTTPEVGHELFKIGTLTDKVPQFHLLAGGNPRPESFLISPLYQITIDADVRREAVGAAD